MHTHHVLENVLELAHTASVIVPDALHCTEKAVTFDGALHGLCAAAEHSSTVRPGRAREGWNDALLCKTIQVLCNERLDAIVQLVAV